jgi:hypothetical protein
VNGGKDIQPIGVRVVAFCAAMAALAALILELPHSSLAFAVIYYVGAAAGTVVVIITFFWLIEPWPLARRITVVLTLFGAAIVLGGVAGGALSSPRLSGSPSYAQRLNAGFNQLAKRRERAYRKIEQTRKPRQQAHQLRLLSAAFAACASSLRRFRASPPPSLSGRLPSQLDAVSDAYSKLAVTITSPSATKARLRRATQRLARSERRFHVSETKLDERGYALVLPKPSRDSG